MAINLSVPRDNNGTPMVNSYKAGASGKKVTAGTHTAVALTATSTPCRAVAVYAYTTNTNTLATGMDTSILAEFSNGTRTGQGEQLIQGASTYIYATDVSSVYISGASGDGVSYVIYS